MEAGEHFMDFIHELVDRNLSSGHENDDAIIFQDSSRRSWRDLHDRSVALAAWLKQEGVVEGVTVGYLGRNSLEIFDLLIACSRIGAIYVPFNFRLPVAGLAHAIAETRPALTFFQDEFGGSVSQLESIGSDVGTNWRSVALLEEVAIGGHSYRDVECRPPITPDEPAWICFTGGTTSASKGVMLSHRNMFAGGLNFVLTAQANRDDIHMVTAALFHVAIVNVMGYWIVGAPVVIVDFDAATALDAMEAESVTTTVLPGAIFHRVLEEQERKPRKQLSLRLVDTGAAPVPPRLVERAREVFKCKVGQIYGQTETAVICTYLYPWEYDRAFRSGGSEPDSSRIKSVGRAVPLCRIAVLDLESSEVLPSGSRGELAVQGPGVMLGYWGREEATRRRFDGGWLRTGDIAEIDDSGYVYLVDRVGSMIITGGENVYPSEVELVICEHPAVLEAAVLAEAHAEWGEQVVAYVRVAEASPLSDAELKAHCRQRLPGYAVPKKLLWSTQFPRLPSGKVDRRQLQNRLLLTPNI